MVLLSVLSPERGGDEREDESAVSDPLELFFDLIFVFAFTQVTAFLSHHLSWAGVLRSVGLLAVLWWGWATYSWLTDSIPSERVLSQRVVILAATVAMFAVALAVPNAFGSAGVIFGVAYFVVRLLHVALYAVAADAAEKTGIRRLAPGFLGGPALLVVAGFLDGPVQSALWVGGVASDYGIAWISGVGEFDLNPEHFVERYRDIVIIALGESVLAMGAGVSRGGLSLSPDVLLAALLGIGLTAALAGLYFDWLTIAAERRLVAADESERSTLARDSYSYLHLLLIVGIVFVSLGLKETVSNVWQPLDAVTAVVLCAGGALYLLGHVAFQLRDVGELNVPRLVAAGISCAVVPVAVRVPAVGSIGALLLLFVALVGYEVRYSASRRRVREGVG